MKSKYNDNELLYLISENDEGAFEILCEKYKPLIINRLRKFKIKNNYFDDFYQECLMTLSNCALKYREDKNYTFNIYLDVSIQNCIRNTLRKEKKYFYDVSLYEVEEIDKIYLKEKSFNQDVYDLNNKIYNIKNSFEKEVMILYSQGETVKEISKNLKCTLQKVYYIIGKYKVKEIRKVDNLWEGLFSNLERQVFDMYKNGYRPYEIASSLSISPEMVYNAIKRIKQKINKQKSNK